MEKSAQKISEIRKHKECLNCHYTIQDENFCPKCGQKNDDKQVTLKEFFTEFIGDFFTFDHKFFRSFKPLILKPGYLTNQYNSGKRANYILPMRLYFFISVIFFFVLSVTESNLQINNSSADDIVNPDSLLHYMQNTTDIENKNVFNIVLELSQKFDEIRPHNNGKRWLKFIDENSSINDTLKKEIAHQLYLPYSISIDSNALNARPVIESIRTLFNSYTDKFPRNEIDTIISRLNTNYHISKRFYDPNVKAQSIIKQLFNSTINDSSKADYYSNQILLNFNFRNILDEYQKDYLVQDGESAKKFGNQIGTQLAYQVQKVRRMDKGVEFITQEFISNLPKVIFFLLPFFALLLKLLYYKSKILYINHLIFTLHVHSVMFIFLSVAAIIGHDIGQIIAMLLSWIHIYLSLIHVYNQSYILTFIKMFTLSFVYAVVCSSVMLLSLFYLIINL